jgi:hypothetical protein
LNKQYDKAAVALDRCAYENRDEIASPSDEEAIYYAKEYVRHFQHLDDFHQLVKKREDPYYAGMKLYYCYYKYKYCECFAYSQQTILFVNYISFTVITDVFVCFLMHLNRHCGCMLAITRFMLAITEIYMFSHGHNGHCGGMLPLLRFMLTTEICVLSCTAILIAVEEKLPKLPKSICFLMATMVIVVVCFLSCALW